MIAQVIGTKYMYTCAKYDEKSYDARGLGVREIVPWS